VPHQTPRKRLQGSKPRMLTMTMWALLLHLRAVSTLTFSDVETLAVRTEWTSPSNAGGDTLLTDGGVAGCFSLLLGSVRISLQYWCPWHRWALAGTFLGGSFLESIFIRITDLIFMTSTHATLQTMGAIPGESGTRVKSARHLIDTAFSLWWCRVLMHQPINGNRILWHFIASARVLASQERQKWMIPAQQESHRAICANLTGMNYSLHNIIIWQVQDYMNFVTIQVHISL